MSGPTIAGNTPTAGDTYRLLRIIGHLVRELGGEATIPESVLIEGAPANLVVAYEELAGRYRLTAAELVEDGPDDPPRLHAVD